MELIKDEIQLKIEQLRENLKPNTSIIEEDNKEYDCDICKDRGFYRPKVQSRMVECSCNRIKKIKRKINSARIPTRFKDSRLDNFKFKDSSHQRAHKYAVVLVKNIDKFINNNWGLYIQGPPSQGKTKLQASIVNELCVDNDYLGVMVNVRELLSDLKDAIGDGRLNEILKAIAENEIIALNDLTGGKRAEDNFTEFERGIIYRLIDSIYEKSKTLIITAKYNYNWLEDKLGQDVRDRIEGMCGKSIIMKGYNWRKREGKKRDKLVNKMINELG